MQICPHYSKRYLDISLNFLFQNNVVTKHLPALWFLCVYHGNQVTVLCISAIMCRIEFPLCVTLIGKKGIKMAAIESRSCLMMLKFGCWITT